MLAAAAFAWGPALRADIVYVDPGSTNPVPPYASWSEAANSLNDAVEAAGAGDTVRVTNGVYALTNEIRIYRDILIESVNGFGTTIVDGQHATRCFNVQATNALLQGLTIRNGNTSIGGGIYLANASRVADCLIVSNTAVWSGGGVSILNGGTLSGTIIAFNTTTGFFGGGISMQEAGLVSNCVIIRNRAESTSDGGGVALSLSGTLRDCIITGNHARVGGGVLAQGVSRAVNCLVAGNTAAQGGGISCGGGAVIESCTIARNAAQVAGGLDAFYGGRVHNTIVFLNTAGTGSNFYFQGSASAPTATYSCLAPLVAGTGMLDEDPQFVDPDAGDYHLAAGSPCIDAGDSTNAPDADLEGTARPQDGDGSSTAEFDIGAYEYVSP
jgi:hypothetical protein